MKTLKTGLFWSMNMVNKMMIHMKIVIALMQTKIVFLSGEDERFNKPRQEFDATFYFCENKYDMKLGNWSLTVKCLWPPGSVSGFADLRVWIQRGIKVRGLSCALLCTLSEVGHILPSIKQIYCSIKIYCPVSKYTAQYQTIYLILPFSAAPGVAVSETNFYHPLKVQMGQSEKKF